MKTNFTLLALMLTFSFQLITFNSNAQANEPGAGNALSFDGVSNWISLPNTVSNFATNDFSVEFWFNSNAIPVGATQAIIGNRNDGCGDGAFWQITFSTNIGFEINVPGPGSVWVATNNVNDGQWHHIALTRSATEMKSYQDGVLIMTSVTTPPDVNNGGVCRIGVGDCSAFWPGGGRFSGQLDEVRIWNIALTQTQIRDNMCQKLIGNEAGLVGYWRFDEGVDNTCSGGQDVCDASGNGNNGVKN